MAHHAAHLPACANCHHLFSTDQPAEFCPRCGQQNHEVNVSFGHLVEETLEGLFHFDGKVFRTAGLLLFRPGMLTRRFLEGQRVPYVPPVRLYVFLSFVFFLLLPYFTKPENARERPVQKIAKQATQLPDEAVTRALLQQMASVPPARRDSLRRLLADSVQQRLSRGRSLNLDYSFDKAPRASAARQSVNTGPTFTIMGRKITEEELARLPEKPSQAQLDSVLRSKGATPGFWTRLGLKRTLRWHNVTSEEAIHQALRGLSLLIFLIMPLAALLLKATYFRQHRHYISHLIFTVHVHCFLFVYSAVVLLLSQLSFMAWAESLLMVVPAVYFVVALRNFYQQSWLKTALKSLLLGLSYALLLSFSVMLVAIGGLMLF